MHNEIKVNTNTILMGERVYLRFFEEKDLDAILKYRIKNLKFLQQFSPVFSENYATLEGVKHFLESQKELIENDQNYSFGIFLKSNDAFIGDVDFFHIQRGPVQKCMIGYALDQAYNGSGLMTEAVKLAVGYAFDELKFHRIEGGVMPRNTGSIRVLEKAGFEKEGIERQGVKINGTWEDHLIYAILSSTAD